MDLAYRVELTSEDIFLSEIVESEMDEYEEFIKSGNVYNMDYYDGSWYALSELRHKLLFYREE